VSKFVNKKAEKAKVFLINDETMLGNKKDMSKGGVFREESGKWRVFFNYPLGVF
jgi:hypothetical protein